MAANLVENRRSAPDEHAAVPIIIACLQILNRFGSIRLLDESGDRMSLQLSPLGQDSVSLWPNVSIARFGTNRLDAEGDQETLSSQAGRQGHRRIDIPLPFHNMAGVHDQQHGVSVSAH